MPPPPLTIKIIHIYEIHFKSLLYIFISNLHNNFRFRLRNNRAALKWLRARRRLARRRRRGRDRWTPAASSTSSSSGSGSGLSSPGTCSFRYEGAGEEIFERSGPCRFFCLFILRLSFEYIRFAGCALNKRNIKTLKCTCKNFQLVKK